MARRSVSCPFAVHFCVPFLCVFLLQAVENCTLFSLSHPLAEQTQSFGLSSTSPAPPHWSPLLVSVSGYRGAQSHAQCLSARANTAQGLAGARPCWAFSAELPPGCSLALGDGRAWGETPENNWDQGGSPGMPWPHLQWDGCDHLLPSAGSCSLCTGTAPDRRTDTSGQLHPRVSPNTKGQRCGESLGRSAFASVAVGR